MKPHDGLPLEKWPLARLVAETAKLLERPDFIVMYPAERLAQGLPTTAAEMRALITQRRQLN